MYLRSSRGRFIAPPRRTATVYVYGSYVRIATHNESINLLATYLQIHTLIYLDVVVVTKVEQKICDKNYREAHITLATKP